MREDPCVLVDIDFAVLLEKAMRLDHKEEEDLEGSDCPSEEEHAAGDGGLAHPGKKSRVFNGSTENKPLNRSHRNRKKKRDAVAQEQGHPRRMETIVDLIGKSNTVDLQQDASKVLCASSSGYGGKREGGNKKRKKKLGLKTLYTIPQAVKLGIRYIAWDGRFPFSVFYPSKLRLICLICRTPRPILDSAQRIIMVLVGSPEDPTFRQACIRFFHAVMREGSNASFSKAQRDHLRGKFPALNLGVTHGKGTLQPINLNNGPHTEMVKRLIGSEDAQRLASFASGGFLLCLHFNRV
jgi:hypothetical protein